MVCGATEPRKESKSTSKYTDEKRETDEEASRRGRARPHDAQTEPATKKGPIASVVHVGKKKCQGGADHSIMFSWARESNGKNMR